jgi:hypothetical protein
MPITNNEELKKLIEEVKVLTSMVLDLYKHFGLTYEPDEK